MLLLLLMLLMLMLMLSVMTACLRLLHCGICDLHCALWKMGHILRGQLMRVWVRLVWMTRRRIRRVHVRREPIQVGESWRVVVSVWGIIDTGLLIG
jgi:hypothetical protein